MHGYGDIRNVAKYKWPRVLIKGKHTKPKIMLTKNTTRGNLLPKTSYMSPIKIKRIKLFPTMIVPTFLATF